LDTCETADFGAYAPTLAQSGLKAAKLPSPFSVADSPSAEPISNYLKPLYKQ
jgi:hypothetical protein